VISLAEDVRDIAGWPASDVDEVVLVGGSTRVPRVRRRVESLFDRPSHSRLDPDQVVAMGAAVQARTSWRVDVGTCSSWT